MIEDIVAKISGNTALTTSEQAEFLTFMQQFIDTSYQLQGLFGIGSAPRTSLRLYSGGIVAGTGQDPDVSSTNFTGTFLLYPPILLPNGDYANIGGMYQGKIMWYGNSTTGKLSVAGGNITLSSLGINSTTSNVVSYHRNDTAGEYNLFGRFSYYDGSYADFFGLLNTTLTGANLVTNGDFTSGTTGWTLTGTPTVENDAAETGKAIEVDSLNYASQTITVSSGEYYLVSVMARDIDGAPIVNIGAVDFVPMRVTSNNSPWVLYVFLYRTSSTSLTFNLKTNAAGGQARFGNVEVFLTTGHSAFSDQNGDTYGNLKIISSGGTTFKQNSGGGAATVLPFAITRTANYSNVPSLLAESSPSTPSSGYGVFYPKTDNLPYFKNDAGTEMLLYNGPNRLALTAAATYYVGYDLGTVTMTVASPAVVSKTSHGLSANDPIVFRTTGALPTGVVAGTTYYVISAGLTANAFEVSASIAGAAVNTSGSQSGAHSAQTGNDSNAGLTTGRAGAFATIQKAVDVVAALDISIYNVDIQVADGLYTAGVIVTGAWVGSGTVTIKGNSGTPANVLVSVTSVDCVKSQLGGRISIQDIELRTTTVGDCLLSTQNSALNYSNLRFGACAANHVRALDGAIIAADGNYFVTGAAAQHWNSTASGLIRVQGKTVTVSGTPAFSGSFAVAQSLGQMIVNSITFSGSATGTRYSSITNAAIATGSGGANYLPGNVAGSTATGGLYS